MPKTRTRVCCAHWYASRPGRTVQAGFGYKVVDNSNSSAMSEGCCVVCWESPSKAYSCKSSGSQQPAVIDLLDSQGNSPEQTGQVSERMCEMEQSTWQRYGRRLYKKRSSTADATEATGEV